MKRYSGTEKTPKGVYLNLSTGEYVQLNRETGMLPGSSESRYIKVPSMLAIITGPFAGLALIIFLPFIGIVGFASFLSYKLWRGIVILERRTVQLGVLSWQPGKAYFTRNSKETQGKPKSKSDEELNNIEKEIAGRKQHGEK